MTSEASGQFLLPLTDWWAETWLPRYPYATDNAAVDGVQRMSRPRALGKRLIEANPAAQSNLLVADIDQPDSALRALSATGNHPLPNALVENPRNGHAHAVWVLAEPVTRTEFAHRKPLAYAAAVTEGLRRAVDGDKGYSGLLVKNPTHTDWATHWLRPTPYSLGELDAELRPYGHMPPPRWRTSKSYTPTGLGRNCSLFDDVRRWAYRETRRFFGNPEGLGAAILAYAVQLNAEFPEPLPDSETRCIAASITRWIVTKSNLWRDGAVVYEATFSAIQSARGRRRAGVQIEGTKTAGVREDLRLWGD